MKSIKLSAIEEFKSYQENKPVLSRKYNVIVKIASVGVCGSDMHYYKHGRIGEQVVDFPFTIGHEASGFIEEVLDDKKDLKVGQLVAIDPAVSCGKCDQCLEGRHHTCRNIKFMGAPGQLQGMTSEFVTVPLENVFSVPESFTPEEAAFIEPLSIGTYAAKLANSEKGDSIGIFGVGPIGLSVLMSLNYNGNIKTYIWDKLEYRLNLAREIGAGFTAQPDSFKIEQELLSYVETGLDVVFECCGDQEALDNAVKVLKPGGKLVIVGIPDNDRISFDISALRRKEISIINVRRQNDSVNDAIKILEHFKDFSSKILTHSFDINEISKAYNIVSNYSDDVIKATLNFRKN